MSGWASLDHNYTLENLSAYLDGRLSGRERARLERHLAGCERCQHERRALQQTVALLRQTPPRAVPRSFVLPRAAQATQAVHRRWNMAFGALRAATAAVTLMLVLLLSSDLLLGSGGLAIPDPTFAPAALARNAAPAPAGAAAPQAELPAAPPTVAALARALPTAPAPLPTAVAEKAAVAPRVLAASPTTARPANTPTARSALASAATPPTFPTATPLGWMATPTLGKGLARLPEPSISRGAPGEPAASFAGVITTTTTEERAVSDKAESRVAVTLTSLAVAAVLPPAAPAAPPTLVPTAVPPTPTALPPTPPPTAVPPTLAPTSRPPTAVPPPTAAAIAPVVPSVAPDAVAPRATAAASSVEGALWWNLWRTVRLLWVALGGVLLMLVAGLIVAAQRRRV